MLLSSKIAADKVLTFLDENFCFIGFCYQSDNPFPPSSAVVSLRIPTLRGRATGARKY